VFSQHLKSGDSRGATALSLSIPITHTRLCLIPEPVGVFLFLLGTSQDGRVSPGAQQARSTPSSHSGPVLATILGFWLTCLPLTFFSQ
jgi:hypothetical protein